MTSFINNTKTAMLLAALIALLGFVGQMLGGGQLALIFAFVFGGGASLIAFFYSDKIAIATMRGQAVDPDDQSSIAGTRFTPAKLHTMTQQLANNAGLPMPKLYVCPHQAPNAFATGRSPKKGAVAVTVGLLGYMDEAEVRGVIAHELAHIKHRDTLISTVAGVVAGMLAVLANMAMWSMMLGGGRDSRDNPMAIVGLIATIILAPMAAALIQMAISRSREFMADREGAIIAGGPEGLISGLRKLEQLSQRIPLNQPNPAQNNLFIVEPLVPGKKMLASLFATHPPVERRVAELSKLVGTM